MTLAFDPGGRSRHIQPPPHSASREESISGLKYGSPSLRPVELLAPLTELTGLFTQPTGTFTSGLSADWSPTPPPGITTVAPEQAPPVGLHSLELQLALLHVPFSSLPAPAMLDYPPRGPRRTSAREVRCVRPERHNPHSIALLAIGSRVICRGNYFVSRCADRRQHSRRRLPRCFPCSLRISHINGLSAT